MKKVGMILVAAVLGLPLVAASAAGADTPVGGGAPGGSSVALCTTPRSKAANVNTDCKTDGNNFETTIAVNPTNPRNLVGAAIEIVRPPGGGFGSILSRPHVSFDGGKTWTTYAVDYGPGFAAADPSVDFDDAGAVYLATNHSGFDGTNGIVVTRSTDGGRTWSAPVDVVASVLRGHGVFNDHPRLAAFGNGHVIVNWVRNVFTQGEVLKSAPVAASVSADGGLTWSSPKKISGQAPFCQGRQGDNACDQTFGNSVAVGPAGAVVTFQHTYEEDDDAERALGRNKYIAVTVDPYTGERTGGPYLIGQSFDGINENDYPIAVGGSQTLHDSQFNLESDGNVTVDPSDPTGRHFAQVWYDDRNAPRPVNPDPYQAVTDADIVVSQSYDLGATWTAPITISRRNDQVMPWAAYDFEGRLQVGFYDRIYDPANHKYGFTLASEVAPGSLQFSFRRVSTALSDPTRDNLFSRGTVDPDFPFPAGSLGEYAAIAVTPDAVVAYWTDLRETACAGTRCGFRQDAYFASVPHP